MCTIIAECVFSLLFQHSRYTMLCTYYSESKYGVEYIVTEYMYIFVNKSYYC